MAELLAENYHNIWARKKKIDLEAKGNASAHDTHIEDSKHYCTIYGHPVTRLLELFFPNIRK